MRSGTVRFGEFLIFLGVLLLGLQYIPWSNFSPSELSDLVMAGGVILLIGFALTLWSPSQLIDELAHVVMLIVGALVVSLLLAQSGVNYWFNFAGPVRVERSFSIEGSFLSENAPSIKFYLINGHITVQSWERENFQAVVVARARGWTSADAEKVLNEVELTLPHASQEGLEYDQRLLRLGLGNAVELDLKLSVPRSRIYQLNAETMNGRIRIEVLNTTQVRLKTLNGKIHLRDIRAQSTAIETLNGEIEGQLSAAQASASTTNGAIEIELGAMSGNYLFSTLNGRIRVDTPDDPQIGYTISAQSTLGRINVSLPEMLFKSQERRHVEGTSAHFERAATKISIRAGTTNGRIEIR